MSKENKIIIGGTAAVIIIITILSLWGSNKNLSETASQNNGSQSSSQGFYEGEKSLEELSRLSSCPMTGDNDAFAKCLTQKGFTMYGAYWCPHCKDQKALFGDSFKYVNYVECTEQTQLCTDKGVQGFPTWIVETATTSSSTPTSLATSTNTNK